MRETSFYEAVLGIRAPWQVSSVEMKLEEGCIEVYVEHECGQRFACPECGQMCRVYDHGEARRWRHLDTCQYQTILHARPPRIRCEEHGVRQARLPWSEPKSRFTQLFERFAIEVLQVTDVQSAARILRVSWDEAHGIMTRAVARGLVRREHAPEPVAKMGVDEKSPGRGQDYFTVVSDLESKTVRYVGDGRKASTLDAYYEGLSAQELAAVETVAMDMSGPYLSSTLRHVPEAAKKVVYDRFHIMQHATKAVDQTRRNEHASLLRQGQASPLGGTRYMWLYNEQDVPEPSQERFRALKSAELKTAKAWAMKELLRRLWNYENKKNARQFLNRFIRGAKLMRIAPLQKLASMLADKKEQILNYVEHRVTSAAVEGLNARIQQLKVQARGYRNRQFFKNAILFKLGGLNLYP